MKMKLTLGLLLGLTFMLPSCKDDDSMYVSKDELSQQSGNVKLTLIGQTENGYSLNEASELTYAGLTNNTYTQNDSIANFTINQTSDAVSEGNSVLFVIRYNTITKKYTISGLDITYNKVIDSKNIILYSGQFDNSNSNSSNLVLTDFIFDQNAGTISGKFAGNRTITNNGAKVTKYIMQVTAIFSINVKLVVNNKAW